MQIVKASEFPYSSADFVVGDDRLTIAVRDGHESCSIDLTRDEARRLADLIRDWAYEAAPIG